MIRRVLLILALCLAGVAHPATWQLDAHQLYGDAQPFMLSGVFTTGGGADVDRGVGTPITSFVGTLDGVIATLVPLGRTSSYDYDNRFYGPPAPGWTIDDSFDMRGLLLTAGGMFFNLYSAPQLIAIDDAGLSVYATGDVKLLSVSSVPEPGTRLLILLAGCMFCAWRLIRR